MKRILPSHQPLERLQQRRHLVFQQPGGAVPFRDGLDGFDHRQDVTLRFDHVFRHPFAREAVSHAGEVVAADRKSTRLNSSHPTTSRMPSSA